MVIEETIRIAAAGEEVGCWLCSQDQMLCMLLCWPYSGIATIRPTFNARLSTRSSVARCLFPFALETAGLGCSSSNLPGLHSFCKGLCREHEKCFSLIHFDRLIVPCIELLDARRAAPWSRRGSCSQRCSVYQRLKSLQNCVQCQPLRERSSNDNFECKCSNP
jgi:hypothetical protein